MIQNPGLANINCWSFNTTPNFSFTVQNSRGYCWIARECNHVGKRPLFPRRWQKLSYRLADDRSCVIAYHSLSTGSLHPWVFKATNASMRQTCMRDRDQVMHRGPQLVPFGNHDVGVSGGIPGMNQAAAFYWYFWEILSWNWWCFIPYISIYFTIMSFLPLLCRYIMMHCVQSAG